MAYLSLFDDCTMTALALTGRSYATTGITGSAAASALSYEQRAILDAVKVVAQALRQ
jgi:hypothetical protein